MDAVPLLGWQVHHVGASADACAEHGDVEPAELRGHETHRRRSRPPHRHVALHREDLRRIRRVPVEDRHPGNPRTGAPRPCRPDPAGPTGDERPSPRGPRLRGSNSMTSGLRLADAGREAKVLPVRQAIVGDLGVGALEGHPSSSRARWAPRQVMSRRRRRGAGSGTGPGPFFSPVEGVAVGVGPPRPSVARSPALSSRPSTVASGTPAGAPR